MNFLIEGASAFTLDFVVHEFIMTVRRLGDCDVTNGKILTHRFIQTAVLAFVPILIGLVVLMYEADKDRDARIETEKNEKLTQARDMEKSDCENERVYEEKEIEKMAKFSNETMSVVGEMLVELREAKRLIRSTDAVSGYNHLVGVFGPLNETWVRKQGALRSDADVIFGNSVAKSITDSDMRRFALDKCDVLTPYRDPRRDKNCADRRRREATALTKRIDHINEKGAIPSNDGSIVIPRDVTTSVHVAKEVLKRLSNCKKAKDACEHHDILRSIADHRVNLAGVVAENLAEQFSAANKKKRDGLKLCESRQAL